MAIQQVEQPIKKATTLRVHVIDHAKEGKPAVNVRMPISLIKWGMKIGQSFSPELKAANVDWEAVTAAIESGELGKIVEVENEADQKTIEVWVE
jgi:hypothetical protein